MRLKHKMRRKHKMYRDELGFMLLGAMFILIVLAGAVAAMLGLSLSQAASNSISTQGSRALLAAQSGLEWGIFRASVGSCVASSGFTLSEQDLSGFNITVTCTSTNYTEGSDTITLYVIESVAQWGTYQTAGEEAMSDYVYRKVNAVIEI